MNEMKSGLVATVSLSNCLVYTVFAAFTAEAIEFFFLFFKRKTRAVAVIGRRHEV